MAHQIADADTSAADAGIDRNRVLALRLQQRPIGDFLAVEFERDRDASYIGYCSRAT